MTGRFEKILTYMDIGRKEGAAVLIGCERAIMQGDLEGGFYIQPTMFKGRNKTRIFQEEIFRPVVAVTTFKDYDAALTLANDPRYGLGAGVRNRDANTCYRAGRAIKAGRVRTNWTTAARGGFRRGRIFVQSDPNVVNQILTEFAKSFTISMLSKVARVRPRRLHTSAPLQCDFGPSTPPGFAA